MEELQAKSRTMKQEGCHPHFIYWVHCNVDLESLKTNKFDKWDFGIVATIVWMDQFHIRNMLT